MAGRKLGSTGEAVRLDRNHFVPVPSFIPFGTSNENATFKVVFLFGFPTVGFEPLGSTRRHPVNVALDAAPLSGAAVLSRLRLRNRGSH